MARRRRRRRQNGEVVIASPPRGRQAVKADEVIFGRQGSSEDLDAWMGQYDEHGLIVPEADPESCFEVVRRSDMLRWAIQCYQDNVDRFHEFEVTRKNIDEKDPEVMRELETLQDYFAQVNESEHFMSVRKKIRFDRMACGNGYAEIIENKAVKVRAGMPTEPDFMYHVSAKNMRFTGLEDAPVQCYFCIRRHGQMTVRAVPKRFRRFARKLANGNVQWFKEWKDPRILDKTTGKYVIANNGNWLREPNDYPNKATSIWWFADPIGGDAYGTPIWLSGICNARGRYQAQFVNYDTLEHGGTPPWMLLIYGRPGRGTKEQLTEWVKGLRDPHTYNEPAVVTIEGAKTGGLTTNARAKGDAEFVSLRDMRSEEYAWGGYLDDCKRSLALLYQLYSVSHDGDMGSLKEAEEQEAYMPTRQDFDSRTTVDIIQNGFGIFNWKMRTKGLTIGNPEDYYRALGMIGRTGGMTMNQMTRQQNELFGTNFPELDHPLYNDMPAAQALALLRQGFVSIDENWQPIPAPKQEPINVQPPAFKSDEGLPDTKLKEIGLTADVINLASLMIRAANEREYEPPDVDDEDLVQ